MFNWAIKEGYIDKNPVIVADIIKTDKNEAGRVLSDVELEKLWNLDEFQTKSRLLLFLKACYHTGSRPAATKVYKKFGIVHAKRFLNHTEIDTTMKYLNIDYGL